MFQAADKSGMSKVRKHYNVLSTNVCRTQLHPYIATPGMQT